MASQLGSNRSELPTARLRHPVVPALLFVLATYVFNLGLNTVLFRLQPVLPGVAQQPIVATPLPLLGAGALSLVTGVAMTYLLLLFVRAVGGSAGHASSAPSSIGAAQLARATAVVVAGSVVTALGFALLVAPGLVVLAHLPFVFVAVALEDQPIARAVETAVSRVLAAPVPVAAATILTALGLAAVTAFGASTSLVPPAIEVVIGATGTALVLLAGLYAFTELYQRDSRRQRGI